MSTVVLDTITGKSTATTVTIGSTPVVSASANSMTIRGEGSAQTSIQQGLAKVRYSFDLNGGQNSFEGSFNCSSGADDGTADATVTFTNAMADQDYTPVSSSADGDICATPSDRTDGKDSRTTAAFKTRIRNNAGTGVDSIAYVALFGDLA